MEEREPLPEQIAEAPSEVTPEEPAPQDPPKRGRSRGGRGRGRSGKSSNKSEPTNGKSAKDSAAPAPIAESAPPVRGSSDRHQLIVEEEDEADEVLPPRTPARRPPTFRDFDEIPDDFD